MCELFETSEVLAVVLMKIQAFWNVTPCQPVHINALKKHNAFIFKIMRSNNP
jgi:hypothetical protein